MFSRIAILAPGLLGASIAMALKSRGNPAHIRIWARREETRKELSSLHWCDQVVDTAEQCAANADLVVLCPPVDVIPDLLAQIAPHLSPGTLVTDVGSTKEAICAAGESLITGQSQFIGSHPMAGSEKNGHKHATATLFEGRTCILTPTSSSPKEQTGSLAAFWESLGMRVTLLPPKEHDLQVAWASHLPHLIASALSRKLQQEAPRAGLYSGQGLRDTTRIAAGDPGLWTAIFEANQEKVSLTLDQWIRELEDWQKILQTQDWPRLRQYLDEAKDFRNSLS